MAARVTLTVQDPQDILDTYGAGALARLERDTTSAMSGATEITTVAIVAGSTEYEYRDQTGVAGTSWYRWRYSTATPTLSTHYSGYGPVFQAGASDGPLSLETVKTWANIDDTADDGWLPIAVGAINRAIIRGIGVDLGPSPDTTRTYDGSAAVRDGQRLPIPGGIRTFTTVEVSTDGTTWTDVTTLVRVGPLAHSRPSGEPGAYIEVIPGQYLDLCGYWFVRITGSAFATFAWDAWPLDIVQGGVAALQRMDRDRSGQGAYPTEADAMRYLNKALIDAYRFLYFPPVR